MGTAVMLQDNAGVVKITIILSVTVQVVAPGGLKNKHFQEVANGAVFMVWVRTQYFVLNALKTSPHCNIYIDDDCIYQGCVEHHFRREVRGRSLGESMTRRRSRSPGREHTRRGRSRSPLRPSSPPPLERQSGPQRQPSPVHQIRGRSRSLQQQQKQSPPRTLLRPRGRSPVFDVNKFAYSQINVVRTGVDIFRPSFLQRKTFPAGATHTPEKQGMQQSSESLAPTNTNNFHPFVAPRNPLGTISTNTPRQELARQSTDEPYIEDPYFVLGVREGAFEKEILEAYQRQMWEVELGRVADTGYTVAPGANNVWDQSVAHLRVAKKKLVGY